MKSATQFASACRTEAVNGSRPQRRHCLAAVAVPDLPGRSTVLQIGAPDRAADGVASARRVGTPSASAEQVNLGPNLGQRVARRLDPVNAWDRVEDDFPSLRGELVDAFRQFDRPETCQLAGIRPERPWRRSPRHRPGRSGPRPGNTPAPPPAAPTSRRPGSRRSYRTPARARGARSRPRAGCGIGRSGLLPAALVNRKAVTAK